MYGKKRQGNDASRFPIMAGLFVMVGVLQYVDGKVENSAVALLLGFLAQMLLLALVLFWSIDIQSRIVGKDIRVALVSATIFLLLWLVIRYAKYCFFSYDGTIRRHLWYAYYIPQLAISPLCVFLSFRLGDVDTVSDNRKWFLLAIPSLVLIVLVLTNDIHQSVFRFLPDYRDWSSHYVHGPVFYVVMAYNILSMMVVVVAGFFRCKVDSCRKRFWLPLLALLAGIVANWYEYCYELDSYNMPELFCLTFILVVESCLSIGFIPSNTRYRELFEQSGIRAMITDLSLQPVMSSRLDGQFGLSSLPDAAKKPSLITPDCRLSSMPIAGGHVFWTDDLSTIHRLNDELEDVSVQLAGENELVAANNRMEGMRSSMAKQEELLDRIHKATRSQILSIDSLLDCHGKDFRKNLMHVCVLEAYVKRRSNLEILLDGKSVAYGELDYCIGESLEYLREYGVACAFRRSGKDMRNQWAIVRCYELFEMAVEAALPALTDLMVHVESDGTRLFLKMVMESPTAVVKDGGLSVTEDEGVAYYAATIGGET